MPYDPPVDQLIREIAEIVHRELGKERFATNQLNAASELYMENFNKARFYLNSRKKGPEQTLVQVLDKLHKYEEPPYRIKRDVCALILKNLNGILDELEKEAK
jgi:hypothetical protein